MEEYNVSYREGFLHKIYVDIQLATVLKKQYNESSKNMLRSYDNFNSHQDHVTTTRTLQNHNINNLECIKWVFKAREKNGYSNKKYCQIFRSYIIKNSKLKRESCKGYTL